MAMVEVRVPDIGDFKEVAVIELLVKPGDTVAVEQSLITVESDKASMEIPSSHAGVLRELRVTLGDKVGEGSVLALVETAAAAAAVPAEVAEAAASAATAAAAPTPPAAPAAPAAPAVPAGAAPAAVAPVPAAPAPASGAPIEVRVPDIGDFKDVAVIEVMVKPGDTVRAEQSLITVESDKASMEIPSSHAGTVRELRVALGERISQGSVILLLAPDAVAEPAPASAAASAPAQTVATGVAAAAPMPAPAAAAPAAVVAPAAQATAVAATAQAAAGTLAHASPSVRRFARELGVPLAQVAPSGPKGRILHADVQAHVKGVIAAAARQASAPAVSGAAPRVAAGSFPGLLPWPQVDFGKFGPVERRDLSRIKKISGANLHRNWVLIPHVTNHDDADITELEAFRVQLNQEQAGVKVTMLAFMIKAAVAALQKFPEFNASLDGEQLVLKKYFHIGFAADTPSGLVVPVVKDADRKGILQISQEMGELAKKAREGKLAPADMSGGCFSISSLGGIGGRYFTPIINAPEVAIMGVCRSSMEPRWDGKQFAPRLILPLSLSWDHRVIDGASAARFNVYFASLLADFRRIAL